jgi:prephenate dehydratase
MEFDNTEQFYKVIEKIKSITEQVRIFGIYKKGKTIR